MPTLILIAQHFQRVKMFVFRPRFLENVAVVGCDNCVGGDDEGGLTALRGRVVDVLLVDI